MFVIKRVVGCGVCIYAGVAVHWWKWCCLVMCQRTSPRLVSCQHLWVHSPALCRAPCLASPFRLRRSVFRHSVGAGCGVVGRGRGRWRGGGRVCGHGCWLWLVPGAVGYVSGCCRAPCLASPFRLRRSVFRHSLGAGCGVVGVLPVCGRGRCRWRVSYGCSTLWLCLLTVVWVVLVAVAGADGVGFVGVRRCGRVCWPRTGLR